MLDCENMTWKLCELAALFYFIYSFLDLSDFGAFAITLKGIRFLPRKRNTVISTLDQFVDISSGFCLILSEAQQTRGVNNVLDKG